MKKIHLSVILSLFTTLTFCQIDFEPEKIMIEEFQMPFLNSEIIVADVNGDNQKDLISTSLDLGRITLYPNNGGDFTDVIPKSILQNQNEYPSGVSVIDVDNDGLKDIIASNFIANKINWFRNLGDFNFSEMNTFMTIANGPNHSYVVDVDNDGLSDIVLNLTTNDSVVWLKNNGDGTFANGQVIYDTNTYNITKLVCKDLNNDGLPEVMIGDNNNNVYWKRNLGNGVFDVKTQLANANSGKAFNFEDINNDNYPDYISISNLIMYKKISQSGSSFGATQSNTLTNGFSEIKFKDIDEDGITDLVGSTGIGISYLKRFQNGTFGSPTSIISVTPVSYFIADNLNSDNKTDFVIPSYSTNQNSNERKLLAYIKSNTSYVEQLISFYNGAPFTVKIADLDNDGRNDIISSYQSVVWNKNKADNSFTSYRKISNGFPYSNTFTYHIEAADIDNDNDIDIVASTQVGLEIYYNDSVGNFTLGYSLALQYASRNFDVVDVNGDSQKDIVITFREGAGSGFVCLAWIPNITGTTFGNLTTIGVSAYGYESYLLVCTDMDNDSDVDIVTYSPEYSSFHFHTNDGTGIFTKTAYQDSVSATCIAVEDYDNDGDKDVFTAHNYYDGIYVIKNNNGFFENLELIEYKKAYAIDFDDLNGDGFKELIGVYSPNSNSGQHFYYLNNGSSFGTQIILDTEVSYALSSHMAMGDLNNDNKRDIVNSTFFGYKVVYFLNSSTLSIADYEFKDKLVIYPVPFSGQLKWNFPKANSEFCDVTLFDENGKLIYSEKEISSNSINLDFLTKGIYIFKLKSGSNEYSRKIIKN